MTMVLQSCRFHHQQMHRFILPISWIMGLLSGVGVYMHAVPNVFSLMRGVTFSSMSIVWFLFAAAFPLLISATAVFISKPWMIWVISFVKAMFFSLVSLCILNSFGSHGWLIRFLLMFHEILSVPALYVFWSRGIHLSSAPFFGACFGLFSFTILVASMEYRLFYPFYIRLGIL